MNTPHRFGYGRLLPAFVAVVFTLAMLANPLAVFASGWSQAAVIAASIPTSAPIAFAFNPAGNELWVSASPVTGGAIVQVAQRAAGGAWSTALTIASLHSVGQVVVQGLSVSLSASNHAVVAWSSGGGVQIVLRALSGVWQAPVSFAPAGGASNVLAGLDAQGNGVAAWSRQTATASVVEAVSWSAAGAFGAVTQLSSASQGAFLPSLAVNEAGTALVAWQAAAPLDNSAPYQVETATRPAGGSWSAVSAASPVTLQTWSPQVALDGSGGATVVWEAGTTANAYHIYAANRPAGGGWGSPTLLEPGNFYMAGLASVAADAAGNVTAAWVVDDATSGTMFIHSATRPAGGAWGAASSLGQCMSNGGALCLTPPVAAARDGSITAVVWSAVAGAGSPNAAVRLGTGAWAAMVIPGSPKPAFLVVSNNAIASTVWAVPNGVKYHHAWQQSDYR